MKNKTPATKIGASVLVTLAVIILSYLLLPKVTSIGAANGPTQIAQRKSAAAMAKATEKRARLALGKLPQSFEMNRGQFDPQVQFVSRGTGYKAFLTQSETVFVLRKPGMTAGAKNQWDKIKGATKAEKAAERKRLQEARAAERAASKAVVRMSLVGGNPNARMSALEELPGKLNYFRGNNEQKWIRDIPTFRRIIQSGVYPGIDLVYYTNGRELEYDLVVAPGANPSQIAFDFDGAERVEVDAATGGLVIHAAGGAQLRQGKPFLYQELNGVKQPVSGAFTLSGNRAGFSVGEYNRSRPLVIDPAIISYSTYLGGELDDRAHAIAADADGNAYVVGWTLSEEFPVKNAYQAGQNNDSDEAFITKFNPDGSQLIWSTYLGGSGVGFGEGGQLGDGAYGVALDADRNVYVTGYTFSYDFPVRNAMQHNLSDTECCFFGDSFITKLNAAGNQLVFSTYFGGADGDDFGRGIAVDGNNNVYVTGYTNSFAFPTTNPIQGEIDGRIEHFNNNEQSFDGYLTKIDASGQFRVYSTYIGGPQDDLALGVAVDANGVAYVTGWTESTQPIPEESPSPSPSPSPDPDASPTPTPEPTALERFPITDNAFQKNPGGSGQTRDAFVTKVDPTGVEFIYSTFIGGAGHDEAWSVAVGADRGTYITGYTNSGAPIGGANGPVPFQNEFPTTENAYQPNNGGGFDAFLTRFSPDGSQLFYSTYLGGQGNEGPGGEGPNTCDFECGARYDGGAVAVDILGNAYITGWTESTAPAPVCGNGVPEPPDEECDDGNTDNGDGCSSDCQTEFGDGINSTSRPTGADGVGPTPGNFPTKDPFPAEFQPGPGSNPGSSSPESRDAFVAMFNPTPAPTPAASPSPDASPTPTPDPEGTLVYSSFLGGSRRDEGQGITVDPGGNVYVAGWTGLSNLCDCECCEESAASPTGIDGIAAVGDNDFPTWPRPPRPGPFQEVPAEGEDGWVLKLVGGTSGTGGQGLGFMISGQVLTDEGDPLPGVTITLTRPDGTTEPPATTDAQGTYSFSNLPPVPENPYIVTPSGGTFVYTPPSREIIITNKNERADFVASQPEPSPTPEESPTPTATPTPTPTPTPASQALNLSTRLHVLTGDQVGIGGFIITGTDPKHVIVRAIGPSLTRFGIPNPLPDPVLELHGSGGFVTITNNNWRDTQEDQIKASGIPPTDDLEAAIDITLAPGNYTGIIRGNGGTTGIGLIEVYDLDQNAASKLSNISTRGFVGSTPGDSIIAGFILGNSDAPDRIVIRGLGPSLTAQGVPNTLQNPTLELHDGDGALLYTNNDWQDDPDNAAEVASAGLAPSNDLEAAIAVTLPPGVYTAILAGLQNTTGNGLIEIYDRGAGP